MTISIELQNELKNHSKSLSFIKANELLDLVHTKEDLQALIDNLNTSTHGSTTVLYSGSFNGKSDNDAVHTTDAITQLKKDPNLRILDNTEAFKFLDVMPDKSGNTNNLKLYEKLEELFGDYPDYNPALVTQSQANQFLFGTDASGKRVADGAFDIVSKNFVDGATGDVIALAPFANGGQVFGASELPALLSNTNVTQINGIPKSELLAALQQDGILAVFDKVKNISYQQLASTGMISSSIIGDHLVLQNVDAFLNEASKDLHAYYVVHPEAQQKFIDYTNELKKYNPTAYENIKSSMETMRIDGLAHDPITGSKILNKLSLLGLVGGLLLVAGQASAAELSGDHEGAKKIIQDWAIDATGSVAGEFAGAAITGIVGAALVAGGIISAPVAGALILAGSIVGGIYSADAANDLYELTKDKDDNGKRDLYDRITNLMYGANEFKITDPLVATLLGSKTYEMDTTLSRNDIVEMAKKDIAWRYALSAMNPFVITNIDYSKHNQDGKLDLYNLETGVGMTEQYLKDRAAMLTWFIRYYTSVLDSNDLPYDDNGTPELEDDLNFESGNKPYNQQWDSDNTVGNWDFIDLGRKLSGNAEFILKIDGVGVSLSNHKVIFGSSANEKIEGDSQNDFLYGGAGSDEIFGGKGDDYLEGGDGDEQLHGGDDNDRLVGLSGNDELYGDKGIDKLYGDSGDDHLFGGTEADSLYGGAGVDTLYGGDGGDYLEGGDDIDFLHGEASNDTLVGGKGDDSFYGGDGDDQYTDIQGTDDYIFNGNFGNDIVVDEGGKGRIIINQIVMQAGIKLNDKTWLSQDELYYLVLEGNNLIINSKNFTNRSIKIEDWKDGELGIQLNNNEQNPESPIITKGISSETYSNNTFIGSEYIWSGYMNDNNPEYIHQSNLNSIKPNDFYVYSTKAGNDIVNALDESNHIINVDYYNVNTNESSINFINTGNGRNIIYGGLGTDYVVTGSGNDDIHVDPLITYELEDIKIRNAPNEISESHKRLTLGVEIDSNGSLITNWNNVIDAGNGRNRVFGGHGIDIINTGENEDLIFGGAKSDFIYAGNGNDWIYGDALIAQRLESVDQRYMWDFGTNIESLDFLDNTLALNPFFYNSGLKGIVLNSLENINFSDQGGDYIYGGSGNDSILGQGGDDYICGGSGNDIISGDMIKVTRIIQGQFYSGLNNDGYEPILAYEEIINKINLNIEKYDLLVDIYTYIFSGKDKIYGEQGQDTILGGFKSDELYGGNDSDIIYGDSDAIDTYDYSKFFKYRTGIDFGSDAPYYYDYVNRKLSYNIEEAAFKRFEFYNKIQNLNVDYLIGGLQEGGYNGLDFDEYFIVNFIKNNLILDFDDELYGGNGADKIYGEEGADEIYGGDNDDIIYGDFSEIISNHEYDGNDKIYGGNGNDYIYGGNGKNELYGDEGNDKIYAGSDNDAIDGGDGNDQIYSGNGDNVIYGGSGEDFISSGDNNDKIYGGKGDDILLAGMGDDILEGGKGDDHLEGGGGSNTYNFLLGDGNDVIYNESFDLDQNIIFNFGLNEINSALKLGNDLLLNYGSNDRLLIKKYFSDITHQDDSNSNFKFNFNDGTTRNGPEVFDSVKVDNSYSSLDGVPYFIASLLYNIKNYSGDLKKIYYSFPYNYLPNAVYYTQEQREAVKLALNKFSEISDLEFEETNENNANLKFYFDDLTSVNKSEFAGYAEYRGDIFNSMNEVHLDSLDFTKSSDLNVGNYGFEVLLHEIGHALGLKHSFEEKALPFFEENNDNTLMSYTQNSVNDMELKEYDISAIQYMYGVNKNIKTDNSIYTFKDNYIWDGGGVDTFDASNQIQNVYIDLNSGGWSFINKKNPSILGYGQSFIGYGTTIENVIGGSGHDTLISSQKNNILQGGLGQDIYIFNESFGQDEIVEINAENTIKFNFSLDESYLFYRDGKIHYKENIVSVDIEKISLFEINNRNYNLEEFKSKFFSLNGIYYGTDGDDTIEANRANNQIYGNAGNDKIYGGVDDVRLYGGIGNDELYSGNGQDLLDGGEGDDILDGGVGRNTFVFGLNYGHDRVKYSNENNKIQLLNVNLGDIDIHRQDNNLLILIKNTNDSLLLERYFSDISTVIRNEYIEFNNGVIWNKAEIIQQLLKPTSGDDVIIGFDGEQNTLYGLTGNDRIIGNNQDDQLYGGDDDDDLSGYNYYLDAGNDLIFGGNGNDRIYSGTGNDELYGGDGDDVIDNYGGNDIIIGGSGDDKLYGGNGHNTYVFERNFGKDYIYADSIYGKNGFTKIIIKDYDQSEVGVFRDINNNLEIVVKGTDNIISIPNFVSGEDEIIKFEGLFFEKNNTLLSKEDILKILEAGTEFDDNYRLYNKQNIIMDGRDGNDLFYTRNSINLTLKGGDGNDSYTTYASENLKLVGGSGKDIYYLKNSKNILIDDADFDAKIVINAMPMYFLNTLTENYYPDFRYAELVARNDNTSQYKYTKNNVKNSYFEWDQSSGILNLKFNKESLSSHIDVNQADYMNSDDVIFYFENIYSLSDINNLKNINLLIEHDSYIPTASYSLYDRYTQHSYVFLPTEISMQDFIDQSNFKTIGTDHNDIIFGTNNNLYSSKGMISGDEIYAGAGDDQIYTGQGSSLVYGQEGNDQIIADDIVASDEVYGGFGDDIIYNYNSTEQNLITNSSTYLKDNIYGGEGADSIYIKYQSAQAYGGNGNDTIIGNGKLYGENDDDTLTGSGELYGGSGNDILIAGADGAYLDGGDGINHLVGGLGDDTFIVNEFDTYEENDPNGGYDTLHIARSVDLSLGYFEAVTLLGDQNLSVYGNSFNNKLIGNSGNNYLDGRTGSDTMEGGLGDDYYVVDVTDTIATDEDGNTHIIEGDQVVEDSDGGIDTIERWQDARFIGQDGNGNPVLTNSYRYLEDNIENLVLKGSAKTAFGNDLDNIIVGNSQDNYIDGLAGNDTYVFAKGGGTDTYIFEDSIDAVNILKIQGYSANEVFAQKYGDSVYLSFKGTSDHIWLSNYYIADTEETTYQMDQIIFDSGTTWTSTDIDALVNRALTNNAPTVNAAIPMISSNQGAVFSYKFASNVIIDQDSWDSLSYGITLTTTDSSGQYQPIPSWLSFDAATQTLSGTPPSDVTGNLSFFYWGTDMYGFGTGTSFTLKVNLPNQAPTVLNTIADQSVTDAKAFSYTVPSTTFKDPDGDALTYTATLEDGSPLPAWLTFNASTRVLSGTSPDNAASLNIKITVKDTANQSVSDVFKLTFVIQNLTVNGTSSVDTLYGASGNDTITGQAGNDILYGQSGNDTLNGGAGNDTMYGGKGDDIYVVDSATDIISENANEGIDTVQSSVTYILGNDIENLTLTGTTAINATGNALNNTIMGNSAINTLTGGAGDDYLDGGAGNDKLLGGLGNDTYVVDSTSDVITENANEGTDTVRSSVTLTLGNNLENLTLTGTTAINATGNALNNTIIGNSAINTLTGGTGDDYLDGGAGADKLLGGVGNDTYVIDNTNDTITENANEGTDTILSSITFTLGSNLENLTLTGTTAINATGNALNNIIIGNSGSNVLNGGTGNDVLDGLAGNDQFTGGTGADTVIYQLLVVSDAVGGNGSDSWSDFTVGNITTNVNADKIDISDLLVDYTGNYSSSSIDPFIKTVVNGSNTQFYIDRDGGGSTYNSTLLLTLNNVNTNLNDLINNQQIIIG